MFRVLTASGAVGDEWFRGVRTRQFSVPCGSSFRVTLCGKHRFAAKLVNIYASPKVLHQLRVGASEVRARVVHGNSLRPRRPLRGRSQSPSLENGRLDDVNFIEIRV